MLKIFDKYKNCLGKCIFPLILIIVYAVFITLSWGKWGMIIYDTFREALLPQAILDGNIFYKDILNLYPPLGYYLNALLYFIFGNSLNTLYWAGIVNSFLILSFIYFIVKRYSYDLTAFIITLSVMEVFAFRSPEMIASWFFTYSYSFIYAFSSCLLGFLFYVLYKENPSKTKFLLLSLFLAGLSIAFKLDFILFIILPLFELIKLKSFKKILKGCFCLIAPVLAGFLIYFITGGDIKSLFDEFNFLMDFSKAPSVIVFNKDAMPQSIDILVLGKVFISLIRFLVIFGILFSYICFSLSIISKIKNILFKILTGTGFLGFYIKFLAPIIAAKQFIALKVKEDLVFVPYFVTISAILIFLLKYKGDFKSLKGKCSHKEKFYFLLVIFSILISFRTFAAIYLSSIGNFLLAVWWVGFVYFFIEIIPDYLPKISENKKIGAALNIFFIVFGLYFSYIYLHNANNLNIRIESNKGTVYAFKEEVFAINKGLKFIDENIKPDETLLVMDEGLIFNYLTERKTNLKYYALIPHMVDTYGENKIINDLIKNPPDYIFITNKNYMTEAGGYFGIDYAKKIFLFILKNYEHIETIENSKDSDNIEELRIEVYKLLKKL